MKQTGSTEERYSVSQIAEDIRNKIIQQMFVPNEKLVETTLCNYYQVSRTPIREAFRLLEKDGFVVHTPNSGVRVAAISMENAAKSFEITIALCCIEARYAAERITSEDICRLREINSRLREAVKPEERHNLDHEFHDLILQCADNSPLEEHFRLIDKNNILIESILPFKDSRIPHTYMEHENIINALEAHDQELAVAYTRIHFLQAYRSMHDKIEDYLKKQTRKKKK